MRSASFLQRWRQLNKKQKSVLAGGTLSLCLGCLLLGLQLRPQQYFGPCFPEGIQLSRPDFSISALKHRYTFFQRHPLSREQTREKAPYFKSSKELKRYWQCDQARRKSVFLAAYYSLAYFPQDNELKALAVQLLSWSQEPLPQLGQLEREVFHTLLQQETRETSQSNQIARIALNLMQKSNQSGEFNQSIADYQALTQYFKRNNLKMNAGFQQLLLLELAQAQWQSENKEAALKSLENGIKNYSQGGWTKRLLSQAKRWQSLISP